MGTATRGGWRTSSHSHANGGNCIEVSQTRDIIQVRDTTNRAGTLLSFPPGAWRAFTADIKRR